MPDQTLRNGIKGYPKRKWVQGLSPGPPEAFFFLILDWRP
jgi:hypothetical protein